jgi:hypothetical protein
MNTVHRVTVDRPVDDVFAHPNGLTTMTSHAAFEPNGSTGLVGRSARPPSSGSATRPRRGCAWPS